MSDNDKIKDLSAKVDELTTLVGKQSKLIAQTGEQLMQIRIKDVKKETGTEDNRSKVNTDDLVTNDDIVQLVEELQGQLDSLEDRSMKRVFNSQLNESNLDAVVAPITNRDGESPPESVFPKTAKQFTELPGASIIQLCEFYELIVSHEDQQDLQKFIDGGNRTLQEDQKLLFGSKSVSSYDKRAEEISKDELNDLFDELSRYLGLTFRRNKNVW